MSLFASTSVTPRSRWLSVAGIAMLATVLGMGNNLPAVAESSTLAAQSLIVSEVQLDTANNSAGSDGYEFVEVANTTASDIDLTSAGISVDYFAGTDADYAGSGDTPLVLSGSSTVPAHGTLVIAFSYANKTKADFLAHYGLSSLNYATTASKGTGLSNSGALGFRIMQGSTELSRSFVGASQTGTELSAQFGPAVAGSLSVPLTSPNALASPGFVAPAQIGRDASDPATVPAPAVFISEINPDNADAQHNDQDNFEFFELANTTGTDVNLTQAGLSLNYWVPSNTEANEVVPLTIPSDTVIPRRGAVAFWLQYGTGDGMTAVNTSLFTDSDFRAHYGVDASTPVVHVTGQAGMSNSGNRAIQLRAADGTVASMSYYAQVNVGKDAAAVFAVPTEPGTAVNPIWKSQQTPTPGSVASETTNAARKQLPAPSPTPVESPSPTPVESPSPTPVESPSPTPTPVESPSPTPVESPSPTPSPTPSASPTPSPSSSPSGSPEVNTPILQITELAPNTANVNGADGYEFVEVYNATDKPINFADYTLAYLYPNADLTNSQVALWPSTPANPVVQPGGTVVFWIKNGSNNALTAADFNSYYGTSLVAGTNLVEIASGGMSNSGARGLQIQTNTGTVIDRAYYNMAVLTGGSAEASAVTGFGYASDAQGGTMQTALGAAAFSPGTVTAAQVPSTLSSPTPDTIAAVLTDLTGSSDLSADAGDVALGVAVTDDLAAPGDGRGQIKTVTLAVTNNVDAGTTVSNLTPTYPGRFTTTIKAVDLKGKAWLDYTFTVSDGTHTSTLGPVRLTLSTASADPVRLNLNDHQFVSGDVRLAGTAAAGTDGLSLSLDGTPVNQPVASLESAPTLAIDVTATDVFFQNGIVMGSGRNLPVSGDAPPGNVLAIFEDGTYSATSTITADVPVGAVAKSKTLTLTVVAGTKAWPRPDAAENNDDFKFSNARLVLPDGRTLRPSACATALEPAAVAGTAPTTVTCPSASALVSMGDSSGTPVYYDLSFTVPDDAFNTMAHTWSSASAADGIHTVTAAAPSGSISREVIVDNTAPQISTDLTSGATERGQVTIDATAADPAAGTVDGSGLDRLSATLDGAAIPLPHVVSTVDLDAGDHSVVFTAVDHQGNKAVKTVDFQTVDEHPVVAGAAPADGDTVTGDSATLTASASGAAGDKLAVAFKKGYHLSTADGSITGAAGLTDDTASTDRSGATALSADQLAKLATTDGLDSSISSSVQFPYQLFTVAVPADAGDGDRVRLNWKGTANGDARVTMSVLNTATNSWEQVDQHRTAAGATGSFSLGAMVATAEHLNADRKVSVLIQHSAGFTTSSQSTRSSSVTAYNAAATPRNAYDFTIGWETDTQYYNANYELRTTGKDYYRHQLAINKFLLDQRDNLNLQYVLHTGDIVDKSDPSTWTDGGITDGVDDPNGHTGLAACPGLGCSGMNQWANADAAYKMFDDAKLPYSILAGNHDVGHLAEDYSFINKTFPVSRYSGNPWFGGAYVDAKGQFRGQYDLISADGVDLLVLAMGWGAGQPEYDWMNKVIAQYPERKVIIDLHENLETTGGRGPIPTAIFNQVVKTNPNVIMVLGGHYHDAYTRTDDIDDNGDGVPDRTVYSMLFDYQGLPEGGQGYLRLLHFDNAGGTGGTGQIVVRTYSPSLDDFDSDDASLAGRSQEFTIPYAAIGLVPREKVLSTDAFSADVLTNQVIGAEQSVTSGDTVHATWSGLAEGAHGWYVQATNDFGGATFSAVHTFTTVPKPGPLDFTAAPAPTISGDARVGGTLRADPGTWAPVDAGISFGYQWSADGKPINGATDSTLAVMPSLLGKQITVTVVASQDGYTSLTRTSAASAAVGRGAITAGTVAITGTAAVGGTLTATSSGWLPSGVHLAYQWFAGGSAVPGATADRFTVSAGLLGRAITVVVTGTLDGYADSVSASAPTTAVAEGVITPGRVSIAGTVKVGGTVDASTTGWSPTGVHLATQWYANGAAIIGATGTRLVVPASVAGKRLTVKVTASATGYRSVSITSSPTGVVAKGALAVGSVTVSGKLRVGSTVRVVLGGLKPSGITVGYRWFANGKAIAKATGAKLRLSSRQRGAAISVRVTLSKAGYNNLTRTVKAKGTVRR